jgi:hypothetical protein
MAIVLPHTFHDGTGEVASGAQVMENLNTLASAIEAGSNSSEYAWTKKAIIAAEESRTNTAYGTLTAPDQVTLTLQTNGLIVILYQASWAESVAGAARAAIFIGANQLKLATGNANPETQAAYTGGGGANTFRTLASGSAGLWSASGNAYAGDVTTGEIVGLGNSISGGPANQMNAEVGGTTVATSAEITGNMGPLYVFAAAGAYNVSVQFKASSGSVSAKNRKLWAWALS